MRLDPLHRAKRKKSQLKCSMLIRFADFYVREPNLKCGMAMLWEQEK